MRHWISTKESLPKQGEVVLTLSPNGTEQPLKRVGRLWFFPDGSMYVYYTPAFWRQEGGK